MKSLRSLELRYAQFRLMIRSTWRAACINSTIIEFLPFFTWLVWWRYSNLRLKFVARGAPFFETVLEFVILLDRNDTRPNGLNQPAFDGEEEAERSLTSKRMGWPARVKRQFMVKVNGDQSVSTMPLRGAIPSLARSCGPPTHKLYPGVFGRAPRHGR